MKAAVFQGAGRIVLEARPIPHADDLRVARHRVRWSRVVPLDTHLANISSRSAFLVLAEHDRRAFLPEERRRLREMFS